MGLCALSAVAQTAKPSIAPLVLDYERVPALKRQSAALQSTFAQLLESESGVSFLLPGEVETASKTVGRTDFRENDESVMLVAKNAGALYALYSWVQLKPDGDMVLSGRVIRDDGKVMGTASVHQRRGKEALPELLKALVPGYLSELKLKALPVTKAVAGMPQIARAMLASPEIDALIISAVPLAPKLVSTAEEIAGGDSVADVLHRLVTTSRKPIIAVIDAGPMYESLVQKIRAYHVPVFRSADQAVRSLGRYICHRATHAPKPDVTSAPAAPELAVAQV